MNYVPFIGFAFYGASNATQRANFFASWGLLGALSSGPSPSIGLGFMMLLHVGR
jgi:hypothetical protein